MPSCGGRTPGMRMRWRGGWRRGCGKFLECPWCIRSRPTPYSPGWRRGRLRSCGSAGTSTHGMRASPWFAGCARSTRPRRMSIRSCRMLGGVYVSRETAVWGQVRRDLFAGQSDALQFEGARTPAAIPLRTLPGRIPGTSARGLLVAGDRAALREVCWLGMGFARWQRKDPATTWRIFPLWRPDPWSRGLIHHDGPIDHDDKGQPATRGRRVRRGRGPGPGGSAARLVLGDFLVGGHGVDDALQVVQRRELD